MNTKNVRALVVDDNEVNLIMTAEMLAGFGVEAGIASTGQEALEMLADLAYDIVFMDFQMPGMDGVDTVREMRRHGHNMPVILFTANEEEPDWLELSGMDDYLQKPVELESLERVLHKWVGPYKAIRPRRKQQEVQELEASTIMQELVRCGLDCQLAISGIGTEESYILVLKTFIRELPNKLFHISTCVENENWQEFRILIHGYKSVLSSIGAVALGREARKLEVAAEEGNAGYIKEQYPPLETALYALYEELLALFPQEEADGLKRGKGDAMKLLRSLEQIDRLLDELESETAIDILDEMMQLDYGVDINGYLVMIREAIDNYDYDEASKYIRKLIT